MMLAAFAFLLHGEDQDIIYFWSSILMVALPIAIFGVLTYLVLRRYRQDLREKGDGRSS